MNFEEYKQKIKGLEAEFEANKKRLALEFIQANNHHRISDIVTDNIGSIITERIKGHFGTFGSAPCAVYFGTELLKDGSPNKKGKKRNVYQCNLIEKK